MSKVTQIAVTHPTGTIQIYLTPIPTTDRAERRKAELKTVKRIIGLLFGSAARLAHHPTGQPYIADTHVNISISHSVNTAAVAVCDSSVSGIDIESHRPTLLRTASRFLSAEELTLCNTPELLLKAWTAKEATFKAAGINGLVISDISYPHGGDFSKAAVGDGQTDRLFDITHLMHNEEMIAVATSDIVDLP